MNEIKINKREFDLAKKRLKEFSEKTEDELKISKVRTDGGFLGLGDHKVTGYELNDRLETIQKNFMSGNTTKNKVIREFREVYNALETLDKYYIASIVANLEAIRKTSNDVRKQQDTLRKHNEELEEQQNRLNVHQADIKKEQENITIAVNALKAFRKKFEGLNIERISSD